MFRGDRYTKPKASSFIGALLVAVLAAGGAYLSSVIGYFIALLTMLMIIVASYTDSIWPKERKRENTIIFALFWGCMVGVVLPLLGTVFLEGGFEAIYELYMSEP